MFDCMKKTTLPLLAIMVACIALAVANPAYAEEPTRADDLWSPTIVVNTDKAEYASGERIVVTATAENDVAEHAQKTAFGDEGARTERLDELAGDFDIVIAVPDGYAVVEGSAKASAASVLPGEKVTARAVIAKQAGTSAAGASTKTGDAPWILVFAVLVAASAAILAIAAIKRRGAGASSRMLSCLLALVLVVGLSPWAPDSAHAADEDASHPEHVGRGSATFTVGGESVTVTAAVVAEHGESASGFDEIPDGYGQPDPAASEDRTPRVEAVITDAQVQDAGDGAYDVVATMKARIRQGEGSVDLTKGSVSLENAFSANAGAWDRAYPGTIVVAGKDTITATEHFEVGGDADLVWNDANPDSELIWQAICELESHAVAIGGDAVIDADGNAVQVPAMRPYAYREQNAHAASAQSVETLGSNGQACLIAQAAGSDEMATEALETSDKLLEAIGQFVEAGIKEDAGEAIQGAGSILGVIAKGITVIDGASGVSYDLVDVVERLDSISSDIKDLASQVGQMSTQLDSIEQRTEFTTTGDKVADLVKTGLRYKDFVTGAMNDLDRDGAASQGANSAQALTVAAVSPQPGSEAADGNTLVAAQLVAQDNNDRESQIKANYNSLSENDKATLQSLANQTKFAAPNYGASAFETAITLADKATASKWTWGIDNIYNAYSKYVGSYLNWEPETYSLVKAYTAELNLAFTYSYIAAMNELSIEIATSDVADKVAADLTMLEQLLEAADEVCTVNGSADVKALMEPRSDGKVRNLVTGTLFEPYSRDWDRGFAEHAFTARLDLALANRVNGWIARDFDLDDTGKFPTQRYESAISRDQFNTMFKRLQTVRTVDGYDSATSLKAEMELVGLLPSGYSPDGFGSNINWDEYTWDDGWIYRFSKNSVNTEADKSLLLKIRQEAQSCWYFYTESDDNSRKVKDKSSAEHIRDFTGTAVNIAATTEGDLEKKVVLYRLDEKYITGHGWRLYVTYHPLALAVSAGS